MIITDREGCSGSWLAELLLLGDNYSDAYFRQDRKNGKLNVPDQVLHGDGHTDEDLVYMHSLYTGQKIVRFHNTNYKLIRQYWPDDTIIRIVPDTGLYQSIAASFYKTKLAPTNSIDDAYQYIKTYYNLHKFQDPRPRGIDNCLVIDYGSLYELESLKELCEQVFNVTLKDNHIDFFNRYWVLQEFVVDERLLYTGIDKIELFRHFNKQPTFFNLACYIFVYELMNGITEDQRLWTIDSAPQTFSLLLDFMRYR
jgi:hypothetical protein